MSKKAAPNKTFRLSALAAGIMAANSAWVIVPEAMAGLDNCVESSYDADTDSLVPLADGATSTGIYQCIGDVDTSYSGSDVNAIVASSATAAGDDSASPADLSLVNSGTVNGVSGTEFDGTTTQVVVEASAVLVEDSTLNFNNSGTIQAIAEYDPSGLEPEPTATAPTGSESTAVQIDATVLDADEKPVINSITNSGTITSESKVGATDFSDATGIGVSGGAAVKISNSSAGTIEAFATGGADADVEGNAIVIGGGIGDGASAVIDNAGTISASHYGIVIESALENVVIVETEAADTAQFSWEAVPEGADVGEEMYVAAIRNSGTIEVTATTMTDGDTELAGAAIMAEGGMVAVANTGTITGDVILAGGGEFAMEGGTLNGNLLVGYLSEDDAETGGFGGLDFEDGTIEGEVKVSGDISFDAEEAGAMPTLNGDVLGASEIAFEGGTGTINAGYIMAEDMFVNGGATANVNIEPYDEPATPSVLTGAIENAGTLNLKGQLTADTYADSVPADAEEETPEMTGGVVNFMLGDAPDATQLIVVTSATLSSTGAISVTPAELIEDGDSFTVVAGTVAYAGDLTAPSDLEVDGGLYTWTATDMTDGDGTAGLKLTASAPEDLSEFAPTDDPNAGDAAAGLSDALSDASAALDEADAALDTALAETSLDSGSVFDAIVDDGDTVSDALGAALDGLGEAEAAALVAAVEAAVANIVAAENDPLLALSSQLFGLTPEQAAQTLAALAPVSAVQSVGAAASAVGSSVSTSVGSGGRTGKLRTAALNSESGVNAGDGSGVERGFWVQTFYNKGEQDKRQGVEGYSAKTGGLTLGADTEISSNSTVGVAYSYSDTEIEPNKSSSSTDIETHAFTLYGTKNRGKQYLDAALTYGMHEFDSRRVIPFIDTAKAGYDGESWAVTLEMGENRALAGGWNFNPSLGVAWSNIDVDKFTEKDSVAAMTVESKDIDMVVAKLGGTLEGKYRTRGTTWAPKVFANAYYDLKGEQPEARVNFASQAGSQFTTAGAEPEKASFDVGAGVTGYQSGRVTVSGDYVYSTKEDYDAHTVSLTARWKF